MNIIAFQYVSINAYWLIFTIFVTYKHFDSIIYKNDLNKSVYFFRYGHIC